VAQLTPDEALKKAAYYYEELQKRRTCVQLEEQYYQGKQPLRFASDKWREFHAARYESFCDNWCAPVANTPNERLRLLGFRLDNDPKRSPDEEQLWNDWLGNDMEAQSSQGWLHGIVASRSFVLVWGDTDGEPIATWERADQVIVGYDPEFPTRRECAVKTWTDGSDEYMTLYTADQVWKWERKYAESTYTPAQPIAVPPGSRGEGFFNRTATGLYVSGSAIGGWQQRQPGSDSSWPVRNPLGVVPIVEMPNRPMLGADPLSEISGTRAMQDAINLLWAYLFNAADHASFPARVVMGQEPPKLPILDESGNKVGEKPVDLKKLSEDRILWLTGQNAKIGQWDAAKLDVFTTIIETAVAHIAAQTRTPPNQMLLGKGLVNVSADGIKAADAGQVMKVQEMQLFLEPPTREVFRLFALVREDTKMAQACRRGKAQWKDAENHTQAQLVDALQKLGALGFPFPWLAERYGLSGTEIDRILAMKATEAQQSPLNTIARGLSGAPGEPAANGQASNGYGRQRVTAGAGS
jgi:hypothetical protein